MAHALEVRVQDWLSERRDSVEVLASQSAKPADLDPAAVTSLMTSVELAYDDFKVVEVVDLSGAVLVTAKRSRSIRPRLIGSTACRRANRSWLRRLRWMVASTGWLLSRCSTVMAVCRVR